MPVYLDRLEELVGIDTGYDHPVGRDTAADRIGDWADALGCHVDLVAADSGKHVVASLTGEGTHRIVLVCHHDTVFPVGTAKERPLSRRDDHLLGPGVADMKGGIVLALMALEFLSGRARRYGSVELHCVPDEETRASAFATIDRAKAADAALVLECARENGDLVIARKAVCWLRMIASGRAAHAGTHPEEGRSALLALCHEILRCDGLNNARDGLTVVAGTMSSGTTPNVVPDRAEARFDLRAPRLAEIEWALAAMAAYGSHEDVTITMEDIGVTPGIERNPAGDALFAEARAVGGCLGLAIGGVTSGGQSDGNWAAQAGIPTLDGLGPVGGLDHTEEEYMDLRSVPTRCGLLVGLIESVGRGLLDRIPAGVAIRSEARR